MVKFLATLYSLAQDRVVARRDEVPDDEFGAIRSNTAESAGAGATRDEHSPRREPSRRSLVLSPTASDRRKRRRAGEISFGCRNPPAPDALIGGSAGWMLAYAHPDRKGPGRRRVRLAGRAQPLAAPARL